MTDGKQNDVSVANRLAFIPTRKYNYPIEFVICKRRDNESCKIIASLLHQLMMSAIYFKVTCKRRPIANGS